MTGRSDAVANAGSPRISALVPTFRRLDMLQQCLASLWKLDHPFDEVVVVARPDEDPQTWAWLNEQQTQHDGLRLASVFEPGVVQAMNAGMEMATGDFLAIFDDDVRVNPDWTTRILAHFADPKVGAVGGRDRVHRGGRLVEGEVAQAGLRNTFGVLSGNHHLVVGLPRQVDSLKGCNWMLRRAAMGSLQFDTRLCGTGAQFRVETWMCFLLAHAGWTLVLDPGAQVDHFPAVRHDGARTLYSRKRCYEQAANTVASDLAFASAWQKAKYLGYALAVGTRTCPGLYFIAHTMVKRPKVLPTMIFGGWSGFARGWRMATGFGNSPPGRVGSRQSGLE